MEIIAHIRSAYEEKFGIPRQSGLVPDSEAEVIFEKPYRQMDALRGIEGYSHLWILWQFSEVRESGFSATVRPPRLGGNERMGVFATRSPFRPNRIGLSCVRLLGIRTEGKEAPALRISGGDMLNGTPVLDIKPYLPYTDAHPEASSGFSDQTAERLRVLDPEGHLNEVPEKDRAALVEALAQDPRPSYQADSSRVYGMSYAGRNIRFTIEEGNLHVISAKRREQ